MKWMMIVVVGLMTLPTSHAWEYKPKSQVRADKAKAIAKELKAPKKTKLSKSKRFRGLKKKGPRILKGLIVGESGSNIIFRSGFGEYHINKDAVTLRNKKQVARKGLRKNKYYAFRVEPGDIRKKALKARWVEGVNR